MEAKSTLNPGPYEIQNEKSDRFDSFVITTLTLRKRTQPDEVRTIYHAHYLKWPDHGVPTGTKDALLFLETVEHYRRLTRTQSPVLLHCSAGIGRTGTFCAIDIGIRDYLKKHVVDIPSTVVKMRTERAGSVQTEDQYVFAYLAMMEYIKQHQANEERTPDSFQLSQEASSNVSLSDSFFLFWSSRIIDLGSREIEKRVWRQWTRRSTEQIFSNKGERQKMHRAATNSFFIRLHQQDNGINWA